MITRSAWLLLSRIFCRSSTKKKIRKEKNVESTKEKTVESTKEKSPKKKKSGDGPEDHMYPLARQRFVNVREFRGKVLIDIREYYTDNSGELKPGKKGISLTVEQWEKLKDAMEDVNDSVRELS
ncbi:activated RNA polymerase II transcriptional coactivator p15-like [Asterias rubens]|uniref:activated RNA polymerase II transcriptional coactivator p15-like n=1 Tax=Asterias rubens TaxID=7604 RepID=UPI001455409E|nr:activated RNA polymerase II transcriptional coactivator p15-like [Asterias rubens]